ncbi:hypothetical protein OIV83_006355 [Microbotryomycetes sp. JL201]|nr:hypothetical protein OIV83_006355 [Microbotryomycetes sp. JL201]
MTSTANGSLHTTDAEKGHMNGGGAPGRFSHEGGAPFNARNITPGGHPLDQTQPAFPVYHRRFANPAPLGLCGFALTTFMLSLINMQTRGVTVPNIVVGPALFYGGLAQLLAGMWEFACGNTFGATAFSSYGAFWLSYAFIVSPWAQIESSYEDESMLAHGVGFFLFGLLGIAEYVTAHATAIKTAGGAFGIITAFNAWYVAWAGLLTPDTSFFVLPTGDLSKKD